MVIIHIGTYLADVKGYSGVQEFRLQPDPDKAIALQPYGSASPEYVFGDQVPAFESPRFQVAVRGVPHDAVEPYTRAYAVWKDLSLMGVDLSGTHYYIIRPLDTPRLTQVDTNERYIFTFNVEAQKDVE
jgi:hypothetical protein